ncbi:MAG: dihydrofolate reductase [Kiritimatiellia bacterium]|jgi:dihydrofolate reductase|nr:dihydrofolate reductase [Kiritimatiellia bacterium]MDP6809115.1 dihydrofolate reductase [Kiritimatiellia bacterium]MDP7023193.1 dihydrofolate reductase [Kiritimatiellia bacterium]
MTLSIIAALGSNRAIGRNNALLWHLPGDLPRFKRLTTGHPVIMGRKTFESIGKPLPDRLNIVITRSLALQIDGVTVCHGLDDAIAYAAANTAPDDEVFVIGGGDVYAQTLDRAAKLYLTEVDDAPADADAFFPHYGAFSSVLTCEERSDGDLTYRFTVRTRPGTQPG